MIQVQESHNGHILQLSGNYSRVIVVGDIHGCFIELQHLLREVDFTHNDLLISVGDLVNRGPYPMQVLRFFRDTPNAYVVRGNHEARLENLLRGQGEAAWSENITLEQIPENERLSWLYFLATLPDIILTNETTVVHNKLECNTPLQLQKTECVTGLNSGVTPRSKTDIPKWFTDWKNKDYIQTPICIGHEAYKRVELVPNQLYALDTKVDRGRKLTAICFPGKKVVQVDAGKNYRLQAKHAYYTKALDKSPAKVPLDVLLYAHKKGWNTEALPKLTLATNLQNNMFIVAEKVERQFGVHGDIDVSVLEELANVDLKQRIRLYSLQTNDFDIEAVLDLFPSFMNFNEAASLIADLAE